MLIAVEPSRSKVSYCCPPLPEFDHAVLGIGIMNFDPTLPYALIKLPRCESRRLPGSSPITGAHLYFAGQSDLKSYRCLL
jgi:hypothetical protein